MTVLARPADTAGPDGPTPATRFLDALGRGDVPAALLELSPATTVRTEDHAWERHGSAGALEALRAAWDHFPGIAFESHARHIGSGQVIEEARVREVGPPAGPADRATERSLALVGADEPPPAPPLDMPIRLTVVHDDQFVHEVVLSYPRALLREALGLHVDRLDRSLAAVQSAFIAPVGSGFTTYRSEEPRPATGLPAAPTAGAPVPSEPSVQTPRRRSLAMPVALALIVVGVVGLWWVTQGDAGRPPATPQAVVAKDPPKAHSKPKPKPKPADSRAPARRTRGATSAAHPAENGQPDVTLRSDLAFGRDSATLSAAAKRAIAGVARDVRRARLTGTIQVNGYTDDLGSAQHGLQLSRQRAHTVASYLRSRLSGVTIAIVAIGHGEADPVARNTTEAGRLRNRRVTIDLPRR